METVTQKNKLVMTDLVPLWKTLSDQDWADYHSQLAASDEEMAIRWLVGNRGQR
jgi:hypothetical protein